MIDNVLNSIVSKLNEYLNNRFSQSQDLVRLSALSELDEESGSSLKNRLILSLANIEHERFGQKSLPRMGGKPINVYLYIIIAANFPSATYQEGIRLLSAVMSCFQYMPVLTAQNTPDLDSNVEKLVLEIMNLNMQELSQLWGVHGGKYLPSVMYKIRTVRIEEEGLVSDSAALRGFGSKIL